MGLVNVIVLVNAGPQTRDHVPFTIFTVLGKVLECRGSRR